SIKKVIHNYSLFSLAYLLVHVAPWLATICWGIIFHVILSSAWWR
ncbi:MAG: hypothetical protein ACI936_002584, partial [Paraglaciecola sp.]